MQLTTKQKVYGGVLGVCVSAFLLDRTMLGPSSAEAAEPVSSSAVTSPSADTSAAGTAAAPAERPADGRALAHGLARAADERQLDMRALRDAFRAGDSWFPEPAREPVAEVPAGPDPVELFVAAHALSAVMAGHGGGIAVIDERGLAIGESVDGFTLVSVGDRRAVLENAAGRQAVLELPSEDR